MRPRIAVAALLLILGATTLASAASASHSWGNYHWARTKSPFTLKLGDNLSSSWKPYLATTSSDWSQSAVLDTSVVAGLGGRNCKAQTGRVEVCNGRYGYNGWLGIAQIWASGSHITKAVVKMNDSYFSLSRFNNASEKQHVVCQEVGHTFGLDHQDESGAWLDTCMDYYDNVTDDGKSIHPNAHDYEQLEAIYAHLDSTTTIASGTSGPGGKATRIRDSLWVEDLGHGVRRFTFVYWADPGAPHSAPRVD